MSMFGNNWGMGYGGNYYPAPNPDNLMQMRQQQNMQQMPQGQQTPAILWVQGLEGAKYFLVAPGNNVLLMDSEGSSFYIKSTDASGMPLPLRIFDYKERTQAIPAQTPLQQGQFDPEQYITREEFVKWQEAFMQSLRAGNAPDTGEEGVNHG